MEDSEDEVQTAEQEGEAKIKALDNQINEAQEKSEAFQTDATKFKKAKESYEKKIAEFQKDEKNINQMDQKEEEKKKPGFWARVWNGVKYVTKKVVAGVKHVGRKVKRVFTRGDKKNVLTDRYQKYTQACAAYEEKSVCNMKTFNDLVDDGYKTGLPSHKRGHVACVWNENACRPKRKRRSGLRRFTKQTAYPSKRL